MTAYSLRKKIILKISCLLFVVTAALLFGQQFVASAEEEKELIANEILLSDKEIFATSSDDVASVLSAKIESQPEIATASVESFNQEELIESTTTNEMMDVNSADFDVASSVKESVVDDSMEANLENQEDSLPLIELTDSSLIDTLRSANIELWSEDNRSDNLQELINANNLGSAFSFAFHDNTVFWYLEEQGVIAGMDIISKACFFITAETQGETIIDYNYNKYSVLNNKGILSISKVIENDEGL